MDACFTMGEGSAAGVAPMRNVEIVRRFGDWMRGVLP